MSGVRLKTIDKLDTEVFGELDEIYRALPASRRSIFNDPDFLRTCWRAFERNRDPFALILEEGDQIIGGAFFRRDRLKLGGRNRKTIVPLVFRCSEFTPFIVVPGRERDFWRTVISRLLERRQPVFLPRLLSDDVDMLPFLDNRVVRYGEVANPVCLNEDSAFEENIKKKSLRRRTNWFVRNGELTIEHFDDVPAERIRKLAELHIERWAVDDIESKFTDPALISLYERLASTYSDRRNGQNKMVLTDIKFNGVSIAMHLGFVWQDTFLYQIPAVNVEYSDRWPGEVLMKALFEYARDKGYSVFDLGFGDEWYKSRYANASYTYHNVLLESSSAAATTLSAIRRIVKPFAG